MSRAYVPALMFVLGLAAAGAVPARALAQSSNATITGNVTDGNGGVLPGATITVTNEETSLERSVVTGAQGAYQLNGIPPGRYTIKTGLSGFAPDVRKGVVLGIGQTLTLNLALSLAKVEESVLVTAEAPPVDTTKSAVQASISPADVDSLPLVGRRFMDLAQLAPGVSIDNTAANGSADNVAFAGFGEGYKSIWLEGIDVNDEQTAGGTALSNSSRHIFTQESVQEFQILSNSYSVEFGRSGTGVINILTKSGTNTFHTRGYYFLRDQSFQKPNAFSQGNPPFRQQTGGFTAGGPIVASKAWFFANYEGQRAHNDVTVSVPPFVLPVITDPRKDIQQTSSQNTTFAKYTQSLTPKHYLNVNGLFGRLTQTNQDIGGTVAGDGGDNKVQHDEFVSASLTSVLSNDATNELRTAVSDGLKNRPPNGPLSPRVTFPSISYGTGTNFFQGRDQKNFTVGDVFNLHRESGWGTHDLKVGGSANIVKETDTFDDTFQGSYTFLKDQLPVPGVSSTFPVVYQIRVGNPTVDLNVNTYAAFAEDQWRARPGVTITYGVRYDAELFVDNNGLAIPTDIPAAQFWQRFVAGDLRGSPYRTSPNDLKDVAPRVSVAWDPRNDGKTVVRGGYGMYYDRLADTTRGGIIRAYPGGIISTYANDVRVTGIPNTFFPGTPPLSTLSQAGSATISVPNPTGGRVPRTHQTTAGVQHDLGARTAVGVNFIHIRGYDFPRTYNVNAKLPNGTYPVLSSGIVMNMLHMDNEVHSDQVQFTVNERLRRITFQASYTYLRATQFNTDPVNKQAPFDATDFGPGPNDVHHRLVFSGTTDLPYGIQLAGIVTASSAVPYNVITGTDLNGDRDINDTPIVNGVPSGPYSGRGDSFFRTDLRLGKKVTFQKARLEVLWEMQNLFNTVNYGGYVGNMQSVRFGQPTFALQPFQGQLGLRVDF